MALPPSSNRKTAIGIGARFFIMLILSATILKAFRTLLSIQGHMMSSLGHTLSFDMLWLVTVGSLEVIPVKCELIAGSLMHAVCMNQWIVSHPGFICSLWQVFSICSKVLVLLRMARGSIRDGMICDIFLAIMAIQSPFFNLIAARAIPKFLQMRSFFSSHLIGTACAALLLPPAHALMQWSLSTPVFM